MDSLDDVAVYRKLDTSDMLGQLYKFPSQCVNAWSDAESFILPENYKQIDKIVILGMGGSAIGGDLLRAYCSDLVKPLIFVNRDYILPPFVDDATLVIASSYSGNTEETLTAFQESLKVNCKKIVITTGGKLADIAANNNIPLFRIRHISQPRSALGYGFIPLLVFLSKLGFVENIKSELSSMVTELKRNLEKWQETINEGKNLAKNLAREIFGRIVILYTAEMLAQVAFRWKTQINENSKAWAFYEILPELNHNSVVGFQNPLAARQNIVVIILRSELMNPRNFKRCQITADLLQLNNINYRIVDAIGSGKLAQIMNMVYLGDWVSYYLAMLYGIDPTPVYIIERLKKQLNNIQGSLL